MAETDLLLIYLSCSNNSHLWVRKYLNWLHAAWPAWFMDMQMCCSGLSLRSLWVAKCWIQKNKPQAQTYQLLGPLS